VFDLDWKDTYSCNHWKWIN